MQRETSSEDVIAYLRAREITLTYHHPRTGTLQAGIPEAVTTVTGHAS